MEVPDRYTRLKDNKGRMIFEGQNPKHRGRLYVWRQDGVKSFKPVRSSTRIATRASLNPIAAGAPTQPRKIMVDGPFLYTRYVFGTGSTLHLFGEMHAVSDACRPCQRPSCLSITDLLTDMISASQAAGQRLDLFVEQRYNDPKYSSLPVANAENKRPHLVRARSSHGHKSGNFLRVHRINARSSRISPGTDLHPLISALWAGNTKITKTDHALASVVLESNSYSADLREMGVGTTERDATTHDGKSVSRIRKQLMKLPAGARNALIAAFYELLDAQTHPSKKQLALLLMDVAHLARMLYYAGHGAPAPAKVLVSYDGAKHTAHMSMMLNHAIAGGALDAVAQVRGPAAYPPSFWSLKKLVSKPCLMVQFQKNYGFT